jgi:hypothetical protein
MTMQAWPSHHHAIPYSEADLQSPLIAEFQHVKASQVGGLAWSSLTHRDVLTKLGVLQERPGEAPPILSAEGLLLFGTEEALAREFPFLKTSVLWSNTPNNHEKPLVLPRNLHQATHQFAGLMDEAFPIDDDDSSRDRASLAQGIFKQWFTTMLGIRDYAQVRPARFVNQNGYVVLEYPKKPLAECEGQLNLIQTVVSALQPTMQVVEPTRQEALEHACFGMTPIRIEGRFFKIMAPCPVSPSPTLTAQPSDSTLSDHASLDTAPSVTVETDLNPPSHSALTMQAEPSLSQPAQPQVARAPKGTLHTEKPVSRPTERTALILEFCQTPRHREEIQKLLGMNNRDHFRKEVLNKLIAQGLLRPTLPDKPNSPKQQYVRAE